MALRNYQASGVIRDRRLVLDDQDAFRTAMWRMPEGSRVIVTVEDDEAKRSAAANRYLWGPIYGAIEAYTGQDKQTIHDEMCVRFTTETIHYTNPATNEIVELEVVRRTSGMTVSRFHTFVQDVKLHAQEFFGLTFEEEPDDVRQELARADAREAKKKKASAA